MSLFATTSPSYLILESLDLCNDYLSNQFAPELDETIIRIKQLKDTLSIAGWLLTGNEPLKLTLRPKPYGYSGSELAGILQKQHIYVEFADPDYTVLMFSPQNTADDFGAISEALLRIPRRTPIRSKPPAFSVPPHIFTPRQAIFYCNTESLPIEQCIGRICAEFAVSCPPAVPIVICGERLTADAVACMKYYGMQTCTVVKSPKKPCDL